MCITVITIWQMRMFAKLSENSRVTNRMLVSTWTQITFWILFAYFCFWMSYFLICMPFMTPIFVLVPIPKVRKKKAFSDGNSNQSVALSSIYLKILDSMVLSKYNHVLQSSPLQFGFMSGHSTTQCTFVLNEVIDYYSQQFFSLCHTVLRIKSSWSCALCETF